MTLFITNAVRADQSELEIRMFTKPAMPVILISGLV